MRNTIEHESGVINSVNAKTLIGAKREATKEMSFGGGSVTLYFNGEIWTREFWSGVRNFGWNKWEKVR